MADAAADGHRAAGARGGGLTGDQPRWDEDAAARPTSPVPAALPAVSSASRPTRGVRNPARVVGRAVGTHAPFIVVLTAAAALRAVVMLGYPPIMWYGDSYNYLADAVGNTPDPARPDGYPLFLYLFLSFHSLTLIAALQAAMGLAMGVAIYAVLRRRGLVWWGATLAALPVLFDVFEVQLEHMVMADVLFYFLVTLAVAAVCWCDRPPLLAAAGVGLLIGYATTVRSVGEFLLPVVVVGMLLRRMGWRRAAVTAVGGILPIAAYMVWFHGTYGRYALTESTGPFLYSRVSSFSDCLKMKLPADLKPLCDPRPPADRPNSQEYLWSTNTPLWRVSHSQSPPVTQGLSPAARAILRMDGKQFSPTVNTLTKQFAERAIMAQPGAYLSVVTHDTMRTFGWTRVQSDLTGSGGAFEFQSSITPVTKNKALWWVLYYKPDRSALRTYAGPSLGQPQVVQPYAGFLQDYEKYVYLRGTILGGMLLLGAAGILVRWRRLGGVVLLPWAVGAYLIVVPAMTAGFSYRYALAAVPVVCLAAGLAVARDPRRRGGRHGAPAQERISGGRRLGVPSRAEVRRPATPR